MHDSKNRGFTLIELLVVVAVIMLLAGMLFRVGSLVNDRSLRAQATSEMQKIANALEIYYSVYGMYPPVTGVAYKYADNSLRPELIHGVLQGSDHSDGLAAYLYGRGPLDPMADVPSDIRERWMLDLEGLSVRRPTVGAELNIDGEGSFEYSNRVSRIVTPFGGLYHYESKVPYLSYTLEVPGKDLRISSGGQ